MRKLATFVAALMISVAAFAQAPMGFSYQAVVRDAQNAIVANQPITVSITILQGDNLESAKQVYVEQHNVTTNQNGLFTIVVGKGDSAGSIRTVNWSKGNCYIRTKTDYGESTSQLMSVPYALFAENVAPDNIVNVLNNSEVTNKLNFVSKTDIDNFVTSADVTTTVNTALASYATTDNVNSALANYATTANVNTAINNSLANYTTTAQLQEALAAYTKTEDMPEGVNLTGYAKTEDIAAAYTKTEDLADVATTGNYSDLTGTPTIPTVPTNVSAFTNDANYLKTTDAASTYATKESLKPVATTGSYNDLTNKPTIPTVPTDLSGFTNNAGYAKSADIANTYATIVALNQQVQALTNKINTLQTTLTTVQNSMPTKLSDLQNDKIGSLPISKVTIKVTYAQGDSDMAWIESMGQTITNSANATFYVLEGSSIDWELKLDSDPHVVSPFPKTYCTVKVNNVDYTHSDYRTVEYGVTEEGYNTCKLKLHTSAATNNVHDVLLHLESGRSYSASDAGPDYYTLMGRFAEEAQSQYPTAYNNYMKENYAFVQVPKVKFTRNVVTSYGFGNFSNPEKIFETKTKYSVPIPVGGGNVTIEIKIYANQQAG